ncbi:methyl-viologen-reducing hydrogenase subunit delta [candidate division TA06 bacterium DG_78]|uniref:Methyl-viologen-reducing hydrogenase subunit delta n=1 Tax=candidate division TA06 bacterium DG_78 TaxID=1703772 RepID=A0A0S7Y9A9_UNCT6|nr:MAG: methyl-viologen-reducing hydrogenase subunit delta [candidate division TA06 bacterium DG_78]
MMDAGRHPNIKIITNATVEEVTGFVGNFHVKVQKKARYVDEVKCNTCAECVQVCPVVVPDEFQTGFSLRRAIYLPFPQAVPSAYLINMEECLGNNPIACGKCAEVCEPKAIDYDMKDEIVELDVGAIIVATGMDVYDPTPLDEFGYTRYENVVTNIEFERLMGPTGPVAGEFIRPSDKQKPSSVAFIQCVGSRSLKRGNPYCSNICCMNTIKETLLLEEYDPTIEKKVFYIDIRAFGKGFEDLYKRSRETGTQYIRGIPGQIVEDPETKNLILSVEDTTTGKIEEHEAEMVVLALGVKPRDDADIVQRILTLSRTTDGFFMESHPKLKPADAPSAGIFYSGCSEYPKDVKDSVLQSGAAASHAQILFSEGKVKIEALTPIIDNELCKYCGICAKVCPYKAIAFVPKTKKPPVVIEAACHGCGTCGAECPFDAITMRHFADKQIMAIVQSILEEKPEEKIVVFACNWCSYAGADFAGSSRIQMPVNARLIRTMCSGRTDEKFVLEAFRLGAPIVLFSGCHFADCHYIDANRWAQKRVEKLWDKLEKLGIRPERLQLEWIAASEAAKFSKVISELEEMRKKVTKEEIAQTMEILNKEKEKEEEKKKQKAKKST